MSNDKKKNIINTVFLISTLICSILICITFTRLQNSDYSYISTIGKNWSNGPITELKATKEKTPKNFQSIINNTWSGTESGCYCSQENSKEIISSGKCNRILLKQGCTNIKEMQKMPINNWKGQNLYGKVSDNYLNLHTVSDPAECEKADKKTCGKIDTLGNFLCTQKNSECPINFMKVVSASEKMGKKWEKYQVININNNEKILFSNEEKDGEIIAEFRIDDSTPCISAGNNNMIHAPYLLEKNRAKRRCTLWLKDELFDKNFVKIDTISYRRLYNDNKIMKKIENLPKFITDYNYLHEKTNLFARNFIGMKKSCINNMLNSSSKISSSILLNNLQNAETNLSEITFISFVGFTLSIVAILMADIFIVLFFLGEKSFIKNRPLINKSLFVGVTIPMLFLSSLMLIMLISQNYDFSHLGKAGCSDEITLFAIKDFNNDISNNVFTCILIFIFGLYAFFCNMIVIIMDIWYSDLNEAKEKFTVETVKENLKILGKEKLVDDYEEVFYEVEERAWEKKMNNSQNDDENNSLITCIDIRSENELNNSFKSDKISKIDY